MKYKIVMAEDEPDIGRLTMFKLKRAGYEVIWEKDGAAALDRINTEKPDLVVLDIMMPVMDGYEVLEAIRENSALHDLPVLLLTAKAQQADVAKGIELGATDYMRKPFQPNKLVERVAQMLEKKKGPDQKTLPGT
jgi:two-component system, OmpR family, alkaline phosphatase synthesis response regulator PhoP